MLKKKIILGISTLLLFFALPQLAQAASEQDLVTNQGEVIPYDGRDKDFQAPSRLGNQDQSQREKIPLLDNVKPLQGVQPRTVLGNDDRVQVTNTTTFPYSAVVFVVAAYANGESFVGSGALVSPDAVLTAGHVAFDPDLKQWAQTITVYPALNGTDAPYGHATATKMISVSGWTNDLNSQHDIAILRLNDPIGVKTGWFGITSSVDAAETLFTAGYPTDKPRQTMWRTSGKILSMTTDNIFYDLDTYPGQSGSGVYNQDNQIVAVHAYSQDTQNFGTRLNPSVLAWIQDDLATVHEVYRLYNPNSGEHFYTENGVETDQLRAIGWSYEGVAWYTPGTGVAVYRLYNPNTGDHHYTTSLGERDNLVRVGWRDEGVAWQAATKGTATYRLYNPNAQVGTHFYTVNEAERENLIHMGWRDEGIGWYDL